MKPHDNDIRRSPRSASLAVRWDHYLATGSPRAQGDLLQEVDRYVRTEARRRLGAGHPLFEEAAQEALVGVARRIVDHERPEFPAAYVRRVVGNKVANLLERETRRRAREEQQWTPDLSPIEASASADWHDFLDTLRDIVSSDEFWTLVLRYHFDYSYGEIGRLLEKEPNAIRQIALRGRRKCQEHVSRLQGRVPAWVSLLDPEAGGEAGTIDDSSEAGESGPREPRDTDPAERLRRPPAGSGSGPVPDGGATAGPSGPMLAPSVEPVSAPVPSPPPVPTVRERILAGRAGRPLGSPLSILPLTLALTLPLLLQLDPEPAASDDGRREVAPAAPVIDDLDEPGTAGRSAAEPFRPHIRSTAPTASREAPSTSEPDPVGDAPPGDPAAGASPGPAPPGEAPAPTTAVDPTTSALDETSTTIASTTATDRPSTSATTGPPPTGRATTSRPAATTTTRRRWTTTTVVGTTASSATARASTTGTTARPTSSAATTTTRPATTAATTTTVASSPSTTATTTTTAPSTASTTGATRPTTTEPSTTTTAPGRTTGDPGPGGPPIGQ